MSDPGARVDALAAVIMAGEQQASTLRRLGARPSPSRDFVTNAADLMWRLFGD